MALLSLSTINTALQQMESPHQPFGSKCYDSCGFCSGDTLSPATSPSKAPTTDPVAGTFAPTKSSSPTVTTATALTRAPTVYADDDTSFLFSVDIGKEQNCAWFTKKIDVISTRRDKYCFAADGITTSTFWFKVL